MRQYLPCDIEDLLSVRSLYTFSKRRFPAGYVFEGEMHGFVEVVCVSDGRAGVTGGREVYLLERGGLIVHPSNEFHKIWSDGTEAEVVIFSFRADPFPRLKERVFSIGEQKLSELLSLYDEAENIFTFDKESVADVRTGKKAAACALVKRMELFLLSVLSTEGDEGAVLPRGAETYRRIVSEMESRIQEGCSVSDLARACGCSVSALDKCVRKYAGRSAAEHYRILRMTRAEQLLSSGMSVKEVAAELGFSDQNYFSYAFKRYMGTPPSSLRPR